MNEETNKAGFIGLSIPAIIVIVVLGVLIYKSK